MMNAHMQSGNQCGGGGGDEKPKNCIKPVRGHAAISKP
jgi:hypothetical protein